MNTNDILTSFTILNTAGNTLREVRIINHKPNLKSNFTCTTSGYFDNGLEMGAALNKLTGTAPAVYITLNPVNPDLKARACNRLKEKSRETTSDADIVKRDWILVDVDPQRPAGISSTEEEKAKSMEVTVQVYQWLAEQGFSASVTADSGNGYHILYPVDLENTKENTELVKRFLKVLADKFDTDDAKVDQAVFNAARIVKLYGTLSAKGDHTDLRPHRYSIMRKILLDGPDKTISKELLLKVAGPVPKPKVKLVKNSADIKSEFTLQGFMSQYGIRSNKEKSVDGYQEFHLIDCPFDSSHGKNGEVHVGQLVDGKLAFSCKHSSCQGNGWKEFRENFDPIAQRQKTETQPNRPKTEPKTKEPGPDLGDFIDPEIPGFDDYPELLPTTAIESYNPDVLEVIPMEINFPHMRLKGNKGPKGTVQNFEALMKAYGISNRYNLMSKEIETNIPGKFYTMDNAMNSAFAEIKSIAAMHDYPSENLKDFMLLTGDKDPYNPVAGWIESKPWDCVDRIGFLTQTLDAKEPEIALDLVRRWLISAVAAVYEPEGVSARGTLVLQGKQGLGKTSWFWKLVNSNRQWGKESAILNPADNDSVKQCVKYWLVELGELDATFRKADIAALKGFLTRDFDEFRRPYAAAESKYPRRTIFFASVNPKHFLHDDTGNQRFWTIECGDNLIFDHGIDMQQVWAQCLTLYQEGELWHLNKSEQLKLDNLNESYQAIDPIEELITKHYDFKTGGHNNMTSTDVLLSIGYEKPNRVQAKLCSTILRKFTGADPKKSNGRLVFKMPSKTP